VSHYERGLALEATQPAAAIAAYARALAGQPDLADAHNNLGRLLHDDGAVADAESHYRLAICADDGVALYWFNLGVALEDRGRVSEAIAAYEAALGRDDTLADAHFNVARLLEGRARPGAADDAQLLHAAMRHLARYRDLRRARGAR
jgi:tetratricopeptide (TPR) repeat protein